MVGSMLGDVTNQLRDLISVRALAYSSTTGSISSDFDLLFQLAFETSPYDLALTRFKPVRYRWNGPNIVGHREEDEFLINEVGVRYFIGVMIKKCSGLHTPDQYRSTNRRWEWWTCLELTEPLLAIVCFLFAES